MTLDQITLVEAQQSDLPRFKSELQEAFSIAVVKEFGSLPDGPIPSGADLDDTMSAADAVVLRILFAGRPVGGAVLSINPQTHHNALGLFFLSPAEHGRGLGYQAWRAIERRHPETRVWTTHTPYFEKRNIHFYVNKCGFKIVRFYNEHFPDLHGPSTSDLPGGNEGFAFEKVMEDRTVYRIGPATLSAYSFFVRPSDFCRSIGSFHKGNNVADLPQPIRHASLHRRRDPLPPRLDTAMGPA